MKCFQMAIFKPDSNLILMTIYWWVSFWGAAFFKFTNADRLFQNSYYFFRTDFVDFCPSPQRTLSYIFFSHMLNLYADIASDDFIDALCVSSPSPVEIGHLFSLLGNYPTTVAKQIHIRDRNIHILDKIYRNNYNIILDILTWTLK